MRGVPGSGLPAVAVLPVQEADLRALLPGGRRLVPGLQRSGPRVDQTKGLTGVVVSEWPRQKTGLRPSGFLGGGGGSHRKQAGDEAKNSTIRLL